MAVVSAAEAAAEVMAVVRADNGSRLLPRTLRRIQRLQADEVFSICNVGPWPHLIERGSIIVRVPGYDAAKDHKKLGYAASEPMPEIRREAKVVNEFEYTFIEDDGRMVARDMIGVGFGLPLQWALTQYGVFVPAGPLPTSEEIAAAKQELSVYVDRLINEARTAFDAGPKERQLVINERHLWAARQRGLNEAWVSAQHTQESIRCDSCGKFNPSGIAKCQCGNIIDFDLYKKIEIRQRKQREELDLELATAPTKEKK